MKKFVIYYRVSTKGQGESGLGLEAQERYVGIYLKDLTEEYQILKDYHDIKSGAKRRAKLDEAVALAKREGAELLVAKLDRLSREVWEVSKIMKDVTVRVASMPNADNFQLHIYAALAEQEREFISKRTVEAIASKKERAEAEGEEYTHGAEGRDKRNENLKEKYRELESETGFASFIESCLHQKMTYGEIEEAMQLKGIPTLRAGKWSRKQIQRFLQLFDIDYKAIRKGASLCL